MKTATQHNYTLPRHGKIVEWAKLVLITGGSQVVVQIIGVVAGILMIRLLSIKEYAYYTIANTILGTMTMVSDGGISTGVMAQGGKVWQDQDKLGIVLVTGLSLRKQFAIASLIVFVPILFYLLRHQGASWFTAVSIVLALIPAFFAALSDSLLEIVPKLHQDIKALQLNQLIVSVGRLLVSCLLLVLFPITSVALLANGLPRIYGNIQLKELAKKFANLAQLPDVIERKALLNVTKKILPVTLFYSFSSQITVWLLSLFSTSSSIAQMGALSRLTVFVSFFSLLSSNLLVPRFARINLSKKKELVSFFLLLQCTLLIFCGIIFTSSWLLKSKLLWLLGSPYIGLSKELLLTIISACLALLTAVTGNLLNSRGWIVNPIIVVSINIGSLISSLYLFNITSLSGTLYYNILMNSVFYIFLIYYSFLKLNSVNSEVAIN